MYTVPLWEEVNLGLTTHALPSTTGPMPQQDREGIEDIGYMTCMTLVLLGNYAQTGHFGGPLAYTPYNVAIHLIGPELGGLRYDYRRPKHPQCDKFMLAGGHCIPTCYALWIIMGQALARKYAATGDRRYYVDPHVAMARQTIDLLGMLEEKTKGNLSGAEERLMAQVLYDLRMRFVEHAKTK